MIVLDLPFGYIGPCQYDTWLHHSFNATAYLVVSLINMHVINSRFHCSYQPQDFRRSNRNGIYYLYSPVHLEGLNLLFIYLFFFNYYYRCTVHHTPKVNVLLDLARQHWLTTAHHYWCHWLRWSRDTSHKVVKPNVQSWGDTNRQVPSLSVVLFMRQRNVTCNLRARINRR